MVVVAALGVVVDVVVDDDIVVVALLAAPVAVEIPLIEVLGHVDGLATAIVAFAAVAAVVGVAMVLTSQGFGWASLVWGQERQNLRGWMRIHRESCSCWTWLTGRCVGERSC